MRAVHRFLERAAAVDAPVLLEGETGTGKSHLAGLIHARSERRRERFLAVNCAGVPESLFESEFFGHRRGAFTGATRARVGYFEEACGGSLFLDEIGELPGSQQAKLLTALEEGRIRRVGGGREREVDVRVMAATVRDLSRAVRAREFRSDLYHRLALLRCRLPPLRDRPEDIEPLAESFLARLAPRHGHDRVELTSDALTFLRGRPWPGNVRQLAHALEAVLILFGGGPVTVDALEHVLEGAEPLPAADGDPGVAPTGRGGDAPGSREPAPPKGATRYSFYGTDAQEKAMIEDALHRHRGNRTRTARDLGMARNTLRSKMRKYGIG